MLKRTFVSSERKRFPTRCQKRNARCGLPPRSREPKTTSAAAADDRLDQLGHLGRVVLHVGVLDHRDLALGGRDRRPDRRALALVALPDHGRARRLGDRGRVVDASRRRRRSPSCRARARRCARAPRRSSSPRCRPGPGTRPSPRDRTRRSACGRSGGGGRRARAAGRPRAQRSRRRAARSAPRRPPSSGVDRAIVFTPSRRWMICVVSTSWARMSCCCVVVCESSVCPSVASALSS